MTLDKFCYHIASHGCVYSRRYPGHPYSCRGLPARAVVERTADTDGRSGRIFEQYPKPRRPFDGRVHCGEHHRGERTVGSGVRFNNLRQDAEFQLVPTRKAAAEVVKALKAGKTTVDLTGNSSAAGIAADDADASRIPAASVNRQTRIADRLVPLHRDSMM